MLRLLRTLLVTVCAVLLFLYLNALPEPSQPTWFSATLQHIRGVISPASTKLEDALIERLDAILRTQYGYQIGPHQQIRLESPPRLIEWTTNRPSGFYEYADTVPQVGPYYTRSLETVYKAYGRFLDSVDLQELLGDDRSSWPAYIRQLQIYKELVQKSNGLETESAKSLRSDIEKLVKDAEKNERKKRKSENEDKARLYALAYVRYMNIAFRVNVTDSEDTHLRPSYSMDPSFDEWVNSPPSFSPESVSGQAMVKMTADAPAGGSIPSTVPPTGVVASTLEGSAHAILNFKRIGKIEIRPGAWFDPFVVKRFAKGPFRAGTKVWGPGGDFPAIPVALVVAQEPSVALDLAGVQDEVKSATVTSVGPLQFEAGSIEVKTEAGRTTLIHNPRRVYLLAVITREMPYVQ